MKILLVDDEPNIIKSLRRIFRAHPWEIITAGKADEALSVLANQQPNLMITDYVLPGQNGLELARETLLIYPELPIFVLSGNLSKKMIPETLRPKLKLFHKPWDREELIRAIQEVEAGLTE